MSRLFWSRNCPINCSWDLWFVSAWIWLKSLAICGTWIGIQMYPVFEISFFDASRDSRQLKDKVPTLPHNSFGMFWQCALHGVLGGEHRWTCLWRGHGSSLQWDASCTCSNTIQTCDCWIWDKSWAINILLSVSINYQFINGVLISGNYLFDLASTGSSGNCAFQPFSR